MITIKIDGVEYSNVSSVSPSVEYDFYYDVKTMDGKIHRDIKGKRTNFDVLFFNGNFEQYDQLKKMLLAKGTVWLEVPDSYSGTISGDYIVTVSNDELKGKLWVGGYYNTALSVFFERVGYDE
jgi:hypothetical protein